MAKKENPDGTPTYKGPSETVVALGQSQIDSWVGMTAGAAAGAIAGTATHNKDKTEKMKKAIEYKDEKKLFKKAEDFGEGWKHGASKFSEKEIEEAEKLLKDSGFIKQTWQSMGRGGKAMWGAIVSAAVIGSVAQLTGFFRGQKKAVAAREQFNEITAENAHLKGKLASVSAAIDETVKKTSFTDKLETERGTSVSAEPSR